MPPQTDATEPNEDGVPSTRAGVPLDKPPRPEMSDRTPAPVLQPIVPTRQVKAARTLWLVSFAAGFIVILFTFVSRDDQLERLRELVTDLAPERDSETLTALASLVFWGTLGLLVLVIVIEAIALRAMMRGHGGARWALMLILFANAGVLLIADALLIAPGEEGLYLRISLVAELALAGAGLVLSLFPSASTWFRAQKKRRRRWHT
ncbi:hypothetical protein [Homoserinimonas sp. A520]